MSDPNLQMQRQIQALQDDLERLRKADAGAVAVTYTPTYSGASTTGVTTYTGQAGKYVRFGPFVTFTLYIGWSAATGTGQAVIGLPLNVANVTLQFHSASIWYQGVTYAGTGVITLIRPNTARAELWTPASNAASSSVDVEAAGEIVMTGSYFV